MSIATQVSFRNMDRSPALAERIGHEVEKLGRYAPELTHCEVMVEALHRHHRFGHRYQIHLTLRRPGPDVVVTRGSPARRILAATESPEQPAKHGEVEPEHRDAYVVVRDVFDVARRRLEDVIRRERDRRRVKTTPVPPGETVATVRHQRSSVPP